MHGSTDKEEVALLHRAVCPKEVGLEVNIEEVAGNTLDGVVEGKDVDALAVRDVTARGYSNNIGEADAEVLSDDLVHTDVGVVAGLVGQDDADGITALLALDEDGVATEELKFLHLGGT